MTRSWCRSPGDSTLPGRFHLEVRRIADRGRGRLRQAFARASFRWAGRGRVRRPRKLPDVDGGRDGSVTAIGSEHLPWRKSQCLPVETNDSSRSDTKTDLPFYFERQSVARVITGAVRHEVPLGIGAYWHRLSGGKWLAPAWRRGAELAERKA